MIYRLEHSLHNHIFIRLDKVQDQEKVRSPWAKYMKTGVKTTKELFEDVPIERVYDETRGQQFLILGAPGSGKTTTLLNLARVLVERAKADNTQKIPVLLNLSSWKKDNQSIKEWILDNLKFKYGIRRDIGQKWLDEKVILPLLDGLDELEAARQKLCIQKINEFLADFWQVGEVVVCSRTEEYELQQLPLSLNGAIILQPLTEAKIKDFIYQTEGKILWESIQSDAEILELAKSPLFLDVIVLAWQEISFKEWQQLETSDARQTYLWEAYITRMLAQANHNFSADKAKQKKAYRDNKTLPWLRWLAWQLTRRKETEFFLEKLQPNFLEQNQQILFGISFGLILGLIVNIIVSLVFGIIFLLVENDFLYGIVSGSVIGFPISLLVWLCISLIFGRGKNYTDLMIISINTSEEINRIFIRLRDGFLGGFIGAFTLGLFWHMRLLGSLTSSLFIGAGFLIVAVVLSYASIFIEHHLINKITLIETLSFSLSIFLKLSIQMLTGYIFTSLILTTVLILLTYIFAFVVNGYIPDNHIEFLSFFGIGFFTLISSIYISLSLPYLVLKSIQGKPILFKKKPNEGTQLAIKNALIQLILGIALISMVYIPFYFLQKIHPSFGITFPLIFTIGLSITLWKSIIPLIQHFILWFTLLCWDRIPLNYAVFLDYCTDHLFLQRVGGGYRFIHRNLQEHLATQYEASLQSK